MTEALWDHGGKKEPPCIVINKISWFPAFKISEIKADQILS